MLTGIQKMKIRLAYSALPRPAKEEVVARGKTILQNPPARRAKMARAILTEIRLIEQGGGI